MTDIALLIADMVKQGVSAEIVGRVAAALAEREPVVVKDENAERRRAADRERKRNVRGNPQNSPDGGGNGSPSPDGPFPFPHTPNPNPLNPPSPPTTTEGARGEIVELHPKTKPPDKRAHRMPEDFTLTPERLAYARKEGLSDETAVREFSKFTGHHGARGNRFVNWDLAWQGWVRNSVDRFGGPRGHAARANGSQPDSLLGAYRRAAARFANPNDVPE